ncbi:MAG: IS5 family transposase [Methylococcales bacterium]
MNRIELSDAEWVRLLPFLKEQPGIHVGLPDTCRLFISASLWILRSGAQWRSLPSGHGKWNSVFKRFSRWCANGIWGKLLGYFSQEADLQDVSIDGSVIRAHACAAGAANSTAESEALGRSKGGFSCKVHALCDALGLPLKFTLTGGQEAECKQAVPLLENVKALAVLADKGYDTNELRAWLKEQRITALIPPKSNRVEEIACDFWHYKDRHVVE